MSRRAKTLLALFLSSTVLAGGWPARGPAVAAASHTPPLEERRPCATCPSAPRESAADPRDGLSAFGRRTQPLPLAPIQRSLFEGARVNLISTSTGGLAFAVNDLELAGPMPILFQRI